MCPVLDHDLSPPAVRPPVAAHHPSMGTQAVDPQALAAMLPSAMLHSDEVVLLLTKPSLWFILFTSGRFITVVILCGILAEQAMLYRGPFTPRSIAVLTMLLAAGRLVWGLMVWTSHVYMLTNHRIVTIKGVLNVQVYQANLRKIQRTVVYRPWYMRIVGIGTIGFATAATYTFDSVWQMVARPLDVHAKITEQIGKHQG